MAALTDKRERFCQEYLVDCSAAGAARRAGYSDRNAKRIGYQLMQEEVIQDRIEELQRERGERLRFTQDDVLRELSILVRSSVADYRIDAQGHVVLVDGVPEHMIRALSSVKRRVRYDENGGQIIETEFRLWDKPAAIRMAGQHFGTFSEKHEVEHKGAVRFLPPTAPPPTDEVQESPNA